MNLSLQRSRGFLAGFLVLDGSARARRHGTLRVSIVISFTSSSGNKLERVGA